MGLGPRDILVRRRVYRFKNYGLSVEGSSSEIGDSYLWDQGNGENLSIKTLQNVFRSVR